MTILSINKTTGDKGDSSVSGESLFFVYLSCSLVVHLYIEVQSMEKLSGTKIRKTSFVNKISDSFAEFQLLIQSVPTVTFALFIVAVFSMNLLANKSVDLPFNWLSLIHI